MESVAASSKKSFGLMPRLRRVFWKLISVLPDRPYLSLKYLSIFGRLPDLKAPKRFSELQQLRKLTDRNPIYPTVVDKAAAKDFITSRVGKDHVIPTYWVGTDFGEIDWETVPLPSVVKPTHASGAGFFLREREDIETLMAARPEEDWLSLDHASFNREWAYLNVPPRIIIEKMIGREDEVLSDYRFYCFNGTPVHIEIRTPRDGRMYESVYLPDWTPTQIHMDYYPVLPEPLPRPAKLEDMVEIARKLSRDLGFARIDLYDTDGMIFVGEITLYPSGGFETFVPDSYDFELGQYWQKYVA